jgi:bifunctional UDP-N-acetylglucosamine pyrophosphorylase/glucosamine-1-phosphate N-acetyltransferase
MQRRAEAVAAVLLAAGKGTRMKSATPKVLHTLSGRPMIGHVLRTVQELGLTKICAVIGGDIPALKAYLETQAAITLTVQTERLGTGEAVACAGFGLHNTAVPAYARGHALSGPALECRYVLVCAGDTPALEAQVLEDFLRFCEERQSRLAVLAMDHPEPMGYGRILLDTAGQLSAIVEEKDANPEQKKVRLCNSGVIFAEREHLFQLLAQLTPDNAQREYYLTDCFHLSRQMNIPADVFVTARYESFDGVNNRVQLSALESRLQRRLRQSWAMQGVTFHLAETSYLEDSVILGEDVLVGPHCTLMGQTRIGRGCEIGSHVFLKDVIIPDGTVVPPGTIRQGP